MQNEILHLVNRIAPLPSQVAYLAAMHAFLSEQVSPLMGATRVALFGSSSNGLWTRSSDVDVTFIVPLCNTKVKRITKLRVIRDLIKQQHLPIVEHARIPVLKINMDPLWLDVSVNNISGVENSRLVQTWAAMDRRFIPLSHAIKYWATKRGINDRATGTLSTYTLLLQLVFLFQKRGFFPSFSSFSKPLAPFDELNGVERDYPFNTTVSVCHNDEIWEDSLFYDFFEIFSNFENGVEIIDGHVIPSSSGTLVMRCPLTEKDVNRMDSATWKRIHGEFLRANQMLKNGATLEQIAHSRMVVEFAHEDYSSASAVPACVTNPQNPQYHIQHVDYLKPPVMQCKSVRGAPCPPMKTSYWRSFALDVKDGGCGEPKKICGTTLMPSLGPPRYAVEPVDVKELIKFL